MNFLKPARKVHAVFLHCSASDHPQHDSIDVIRKWHVEENGWEDVGYHYFITKGGQVQKGRDLERNPAAQKGHNTGTIAICCHGLEKRLFTDQQMAALYTLCYDIHESYGGLVSFHGHCEVSAKACPVFDYRAVLRLDSNGFMHKGPTLQEPPEHLRHLRMDLPILGTGHKSLGVALVQHLVGGLVVDGVYGRDTTMAVEDYQRMHGLPVDGVVGRITWDKLISS